jgi:hypothetical protein
MTAEVAHHRAALRLRVVLDGPADVAEGGARLHRLDPLPHGRVRHVQQAAGLGRDLAHRVHPAGVAVPAIDDDGDVDVGHVAGVEAQVRRAARDAVADDVVAAYAGGLGVALVAQAGGEGAVVQDELARGAVDRVGGHAWDDQRDQHVQALGRQPTRPAHALEVLQAVAADRADLDIVRGV